MGHIKLTMKLLVLLAAIGYASAASSHAVTCDECQAGAQGLVDRLLSEESLAEQGAILKAIVCPQLDDPAGCEANVDMWFGDMATCIYNHFVLEGDVCSRLGLCKKASIFTPVTGLARNVPMSLPGLLTTWQLRTPSLRVLSTSRETVSVARMDTLMTVLLLSLPLCLLLCQFLLEFSWNRLLSFARRLLVFARLKIKS